MVKTPWHLRVVGVWFSLLGSVLILLRSRRATTAFALSLLGAVMAAVHGFGISDVSMAALIGPMAVVVTALIYGVVALMIWYSRRTTAAGALR